MRWTCSRFLSVLSPTNSRWIGVLAVGAALAGCTSGEGASLQAFYAPSSGAPAANVFVTIHDGVRAIELRGADFTTTTFGTPHSSSLSVEPGGTVRVAVRLDAAPGVALALGEVAFPVEAGRSYGVFATIRSPGDRPPCLGCAATRAFGLAPSAGASGDSLVISWGSNSRDNPVLY